MKRGLGWFMTGILIATGIASAASGTWLSAAATPSSVEIVTVVTSAGAETTPYLVVYMGSTFFGTPYNSDKAKAWLEMFKDAIQSMPARA